ncbi:MAG: DeoR family transcriptional regulator [Candidatus Pacebacteria bacterium]|jgi:hypothetical protein|nr:DeoR family transcriptional regulator [Candidatus Paceibacterota bacterium]
MEKNTFVQLAKDVYRLTLLFPNKEPLRYKIREIANDIVSDFVLKENNYLNDLLARLEVMDNFFEIALSQDWTSPVKIKEVMSGYREAKNELEMMAKAYGQISAEIPVETAKRTDFILVPQEPRKEEPIVPAGQIIEAPARPKPMIVPETVMPAANAQVPSRILEMPKETIFGTMGGQPADAPEVEGEEDDDNAPLTGSQITRQNRILEFLKERGSAQVWEIQKIFPNVSKRTIRRDFRSMLRQGVIERTGERNTTAYKLKINLS